MSRMDDDIGRRERVVQMKHNLQAYIDESDFMINVNGFCIPTSTAVMLFNDVLLYSNDGEELTDDMKVKEA